MREAAQLQIENEQAAQPPVKQQQVNANTMLANANLFLPRDEGEIISSSNRNASRWRTSASSRSFSRVVVAQIEKFQDVGAFDFFLHTHGIFGTWHRAGV